LAANDDLFHRIANLARRQHYLKGHQMTDEELKTAMGSIAKVSGLNLNEERIEKDITTFKVQLAALERLSKFELPMEAEPPVIFRLKKEGL
jgi:hypothetical protein